MKAMLLIMNELQKNAKLLMMILLTICFISGYSQVTVSGGTAVKVLNNTSVSSSDQMILNSGGTLDVQGTLILKKNLQNLNPTANSLGTGTIEFSGTTNQTISGENVIQNMTVNNTAGLTVAGNTKVNGTLTLTSGVVSLGSSNLQLGPAATVSGTPSATNMVVPTGTGELRKEFAAAGSFTFPVGDATGTAEYSPVSLTFNSGTFASGNYTGVSLSNAQYPGTATSYLTRYWTVTQSGITNFACNATYQYTTADVTGTEGDIFCFKVDPVLPWIAYNASNTGTHTIDAHGLSSFGTFTGNLGNAATPPQIRSLQDKTITGSGCADATQTLLIAGNGTTYWVQSTGSVTHIAGQNIIYYPGTKVDAGGYLHGYISTTYCTPYNHPVAPGNLAGLGDQNPGNESASGLFKIYPNPTPGNFTLELKGDLDASKVRVEIFGILGDRILSKGTVNSRKQVFTLTGKPTGVYVVHVSSDTGSETQKIIKQ